MEVQKPLCDRRTYQHAVLDNGLRVLLVQDKEAVFAAACANVQVRPSSVSGIAHALTEGSRQAPLYVAAIMALTLRRYWLCSH